MEANPSLLEHIRSREKSAMSFPFGECADRQDHDVMWWETERCAELLTSVLVREKSCRLDPTGNPSDARGRNASGEERGFHTL
jgi:hypothetical protein